MNLSFRRGTAPILVSMPHIGTHIPPELRPHYVPRAVEAEDTDWHVEHLYMAIAAELKASVIEATVSRYVIDLNRPPDDKPMYPGASNTELCPTRFFNGDPLYRPGQAPGEEERARRAREYWRPYHAALASELDRLRAVHGFAVLWDAHSIRSEIPWLFEGVLPDFNIGTAGGISAHPAVERAVAAAAEAAAPAYTHAVNGRFKGGYITRTYGNPKRHVHAVQLELAQKTYMEEVPPFQYDEAKAARVRAPIKRMVVAALSAAEALHADSH